MKIFMAVPAIGKFQPLGCSVTVAFFADDLSMHSQKREIRAAVIKVGHFYAAPAGRVMALTAIWTETPFVGITVAVTALIVLYGTEHQIRIVSFAPIFDYLTVTFETIYLLMFTCEGIGSAGMVKSDNRFPTGKCMAAETIF